MASKHSRDVEALRTKERLLEEVEQLRLRLDEAEQTLRAIRTGDVDAILISGPQGEQVFTLSSAERIYRVIVETMNEAALTVNEQGMIVFTNRRFSELVRTPLENIVGRDIASFVPESQQAMIRQLIAEAESRPIRRLSVLASDGTESSVQWSASPLESSEGSTVCLVASDLSELEASLQSVRTLSEQQRELEQREAQLRMFAGHLESLVEARTQELKRSQQQLRAMATELNLSEQYERKRLATELHDHLQQMLVLGRLTIGQGKRLAAGVPACEQMLKKVDDIFSDALTYTRTLVADLSPTVLRDHGLAAALRWLGTYMQKHHLTVTVTLPDEKEPTLPEDQVLLLFQSVRELLINSSKHAGTGQASVRMEQRDGQLQIEVRDDGIGFDLAAAAAAETSNGGVSSKFGLYSIQERMTALGGSFHVQSAPGQGTTATLSLPLASSGEGTGVPGQYILQGGTSSLFHSPLPDSHSPRISVLLVDDHVMVRQGLRAELDAYPDIQLVGEAGNGEEAVRLVDRLRPAVVVMDINMPSMDGIEATARIKTRHPETTVIGISVNAAKENEEAMKRAGAVGLMTKEAAVEQLYGRIKDSVGSL
ncbi:MAG TPA: response regulator, partial [Nitrospira sp.]|nr:response regulator [Nitrospira sp.]